MSHFGRSGPPDIKDTYSLLVLNITFRTSADDLFPLFDKYGKVVDVFIPRDRRTGDSRGFAFVRYKYQDEAQKAVEKLDGRVVDGREIMVQFAKYGPNAERIHTGRIVEPVYRPKGRSRSRSPPPRGRHRDDHKDRDYRRRSRSHSRGRYDREGRHGRDKGSRYRSRTPTRSPGYTKDRSRGKYDDRRSLSRSRSDGSASPRLSRSPRGSASPRRVSASPPRVSATSPRKGSESPRRSPPPSKDAKPDAAHSPPPRSVSPRGRRGDSRSRSPRSDTED